MAFAKLLLASLIGILLQTFASSSTLYFRQSGAKVKMATYPFQNISLPWNDRVDDLVSRLTLDEIQSQMAGGGTIVGPPISRLGIGQYMWDTECLRGDASAQGNATGFPQAIGLAAMFSRDLIFQIASATGKEVRGKHNDFVKQGIFAGHTGASCFSPVINMVRDPRWGRAQETYGEDPFLSGELSQNFVHGLQGDDPRYVQANAGCKHFDVHGGPEDIPVSRSSFNAEVSETDWRMTFLPAFRKCVKAGTYSLMCSYNRINGVPSCANKKLLTDILRGEWNFTGYVVSDAGAIENIISRHHYLNNSVDTVAACVNAGCNLELEPKGTPVYKSLVDAVKQGKLMEEVVRERAKPLFYTRMRLGEFDPPDMNPYAKLDGSVVETQEHKDLAVETAMKSFVLLKNQDNILPLKQDAYKKVAVIGPMADDAGELAGDYHPNQDRSFTKTPLQGLMELYPDAKYKNVCEGGTPCRSYDSNAAKQVVDGADLVFVILGTGVAVEGEGRDRPDLELPGYQSDLLMDVMKNNDNAKIILLLFNAGPLNVTFADESDQVSAIMECFFPAQATGDALVNVLTNKGGSSSPAGRLPVTWPKFASQVPPMVNYSMKGRTYRYMNTDPLYPFGYGLSYSSFQYSGLNIQNKSISAADDLTVTFFITNTGSLDADEVVQCYISWGDQSLPVPIRQLAYFDRIHLSSSQTSSYTAVISSETMMFWDNGKWVIQAGMMNLYCGGQQPNQQRSAPSNVLSGQFTITNTLYIDKF